MCRSKQTPLRRGFLFKGNANELRTVRPDSFHPGVLPRVFWAGVNMKRIFAVLGVLLLWHSPVSADDYKWFVNISSWGDRPFSSASTACNTYISSISGTFVSLTYINDRNFNCRFQSGPNNSFGSYGIYRTGLSCPENTTYNPLDCECNTPKEDKCASTYGKTIDHEFNRGPVDDPSVRNNPPPEVCQNEC